MSTQKTFGNNNKIEYCMGIDEAGRGCERDDAEVLTSEGFKKFCTLEIKKDLVLSINENMELLWQPILDIVTPPGQVTTFIQLKSKTLNSIVTPDHCFDVFREQNKRQTNTNKNKKKPNFYLEHVSVKNLKNTDLIPVCGSFKGQETKYQITIEKFLKKFCFIKNKTMNVHDWESRTEQNLVASFLSYLYKFSLIKENQIIVHLPNNETDLISCLDHFQIGYKSINKEIIIFHEMCTSLNKNQKKKYNLGDLLQYQILKTIKIFPTESLKLFLNNVSETIKLKDQKSKERIKVKNSRLVDLFQEITIKSLMNYSIESKNNTQYLYLDNKRFSKVSDNTLSIIKPKNDENHKAYCLILEKIHNFYIRRKGVGYFTGNCLLGPMVYGCCYCPVTMKEQLKSYEVDDSKVIPRFKRELIFQEIAKSNFVNYELEVVSPETISHSLLKREKYNLNLLSHDCAIKLIKNVLSKVNLTQVYVDTVGDPDKYEKKLKKLFPKIKEIYVEKKADSLFPIVSSASICAKVIRDHLLQEWKFKEQNLIFSKNYGSGYCLDPRLYQWMDDNFNPIFGFPSITRFSWSNCGYYLQKNAVKIRWKPDYMPKLKPLQQKKQENANEKDNNIINKNNNKNTYNKRNNPRKRNFKEIKKKFTKSRRNQKISPFFTKRNLKRVTNKDF
ncbi:intein-containing ribonuclease h2 subunit a precursor [Anaeramoeba flamelloides]|uniref:Ribonuclease n=1 Tax=Anaeramoeba flamelloides TaxID=1746091 RepID=A0ABQ8YJT9_9EUKA|nr:intein-containing ribonuclease h2 subunit a precursor [Anaeramoeba flamelloides]